MGTRAERVIEEFYGFASIPHGSGNEGAVGEYLVNWANERNIKCEMDAYGNVIMEKPASCGCENAPGVILQSHMDMVCVAESGKKYNPIEDGVKIIRGEGFLKADGTSLGADDGAGVAIILYILSDNSLKHPALRAIFTVEEETSMKGAANLDIKYLDGKYLLNLDWEDKDSISTSCSNTVELIFESEVKRVKNSKKAYEIKIGNLLGGHSGCDINMPRANGIKLMAELIFDTDCDVASLRAGKVKNAICAEAAAVIAYDGDIQKAVSNFEAAVKAEYPNEKDIVFTAEETTADTVLARSDRDKFVNFLVSVHSGVFYMSKYIPDFVETSQNIGVVRLEDKLSIEILARSSSKFHSEERKRTAKALGKVYGYKLSVPAENPIWEEKGENYLTKIMEKAYSEVTGKKLKVLGVHAGLECAFFASVKPNMQMVSLGPQLYDVHSPKERWEISSLPETVDFVIRALELILE